MLPSLFVSPSFVTSVTLSVRVLIFMLSSLLAFQALAKGSVDEETIVPLHEQVQNLKKVVLELNRDLYLLEEELLFPSSTQLTVFVSTEAEQQFDVDSVSLEVNGKEVSKYTYSEKQAQALQKGGVHRLHVGHLNAGQHQLVATFRGKGPQKNDYKQTTEFTFSKDTEAKFLEVSIVGQSSDAKPQLQVREWQ